MSSTHSGASPSDGVVSLTQALAVLRRQWVAILLCSLLGIAGGLAMYVTTPASYQATATVRVFPLPADLRSSTVNQKDISMATEAGVATSGTVAAGAAKTLAWTKGIDELLTHVSVTNPTDSFLLDITYTGSSAAGAAAGANAFAKAYLDQREALAKAAVDSVTKSAKDGVTALSADIVALSKKITATNDAGLKQIYEDQRTAKTSQLQVLFGVLSEVQLASLTPGALVGPATEPTSKSAPKLTVNVGAGLILGFLLGVLVAILRDRRDHRLHAGIDLEGRTGLPVLGEVPELPALSGPTGRRLAGVVPDAYRQLAIRMITRAPKGRPVVCLVAGTGAPGAETVPAMVAQAFAAEGSRVALASVDTAVVHSHATLPFESVRLGPEDQVLRRLHAAEPMPEITRGDFEVVVIDAVNLQLDSSRLALAHAARGVVVSVVQGRTLEDDLLECLREMTRSSTPVLGLVVVTPESGRRRATPPPPSGTVPDEPAPSAPTPVAATRPATTPKRPNVPAGRS